MSEPYRPSNAITLLDPDTVDAVRLLHAGALPGRAVEPRGIFLPIELVVAKGRARCRGCGERIAKGETCIQFQLDLYQARFGRWGHATEAWIHQEKCERKGEQDGSE